MARYRRVQNQRSRIAGAAFLIAAGVLLFLANLGFLPIEHVRNYWPLIFVAVGLARITCARPGAILVGGMLILLGTVFTLINTGVFKLHMHDGSWPLSLLFLALGIGGLAKVLDGGRNVERQMFGEQELNIAPFEDTGGTQFSKSDSVPRYGPDLAPLVDNFTLLGTIKRKVESQNFQGGKLNCFLGNIEIDLRRAKMPAGASTATLDLSAFMGSIKLRVPEAWRVTWNGDSVMSSVEDRTIPPVTGGSAPQLVLVGSSVMGSIEIES